MAASASARILGAALVMVGDMNAERLQHAEKVGFTPIDLTKGDNLGDLIARLSGGQKWTSQSMPLGSKRGRKVKTDKKLRRPYSTP
jgi:threonine dehydrogenase-like Zn-dependent dehydrogenase